MTSMQYGKDDVIALRQRLGLTQEGLAYKLGVTFSTVSRWENGHVLPSRMAQTLLGRLASDEEKGAAA